MLSLRLVLAAGPLAQVRRALVAVASAGAGFLLLCSLGYALGHPDESSGALARLLWCTAPLVTTVQLAAAVGRADCVFHPAPGLVTAGCGPLRRALLAATSMALFCYAGSLLALFVFLYLRGNVIDSPLSDSTIDALARGYGLPIGAVITLLSVSPIIAATASGFSLHARSTPNGHRTRTPRSARRAHSHTEAAGLARTPHRTPFAFRALHPRPVALTSPPGFARAVTARNSADSAPSSSSPGPSPEAKPPTVPAPALMGADHLPGPHIVAQPTATPTAPEAAGLPWGIALVSVGLALVAYVSRDAASTRDLVPLPGHLGSTAIAVLAAWVLATTGLVLAGPGLVRVCGRLLAVGRPGAVRLLAGRGLQEEASRLGRPLGALCAVASSAYVAVRLYEAVPGLAEDRPFGPLTGLGAALIMGCTTATALMAVLESRNARAATINALLRHGAPRSVLRRAATLRVATLFIALSTLTWLVAELATMPLLP